MFVCIHMFVCICDLDLTLISKQERLDKAKIQMVIEEAAKETREDASKNGLSPHPSWGLYLVVSPEGLVTCCPPLA